MLKRHTQDTILASVDNGIETIIDPFAMFEFTSSNNVESLNLVALELGLRGNVFGKAAREGEPIDTVALADTINGIATANAFDVIVLRHDCSPVK